MPTIKKYENRRLYDTDSSAYVNLDDVAAMVRRGEPVVVHDVKTGRDLTRDTLLQVLLAAEGGPEMLPIGMLRRVIRATGDDPLQRMLRPHIASSLELMHTQLDELESRMTANFPGFGRANPFAAKAAAAAAPGEAAAGGGAPGATEPQGADDSLDALRRRLDELESRLKRG